MARVEIGKHLAVDTRVCGGRLIFRGTRIMVADAVELSEDGYSPVLIADQYHGIITPEAVAEALSLIRRGVIREVTAKTDRPDFAHAQSMPTINSLRMNRYGIPFPLSREDTKQA